MAEFDYFCTEEELSQFLHGALDEGFRVQLKTQLTEPVHVYFESKDQISEALARRAHQFVLEKPSFTRYPLALLEFEREGKRLWSPRTIEGGPVIEVYFFFPREKEGVLTIPPTLFCYHSVIENPSTGQSEAAGEEVKKEFTRIVSKLRKSARIVKSPKKVGYVSSAVEELVRKGASLAPPYG